MNIETRRFILGLLYIWLGITLMDYGINRIKTDQMWWFGYLQLFFGVLITLDGLSDVKKTI